MAAPITISFAIDGISRVNEAFRSVAKASELMERQTARSVQNELTTRTRGARSFEQLQEKKYRDLQRTLDKEERATEKTEASKAKLAERSADLASRANDKRMQSEVRAAEKAERDKYAARERWEKRSLDMQTRTARMSGKLASDQVREEQATRARFTGGVAGSVMGSVRGTIGTMARAAGSVLALGGGFTMADAVQQSVANSGRAKQLELNSGGAVSKEEVLKTSASVGTASGMPTGSVIDALDAFVAKSGDVKAGLAAIREMAELSLATGADMKDLAAVAGQAQTGTKDIKVTMDMLREVAGMGRAGSVDVRELAQYGGRIFAGASKFEDQRTSTRTIGAMVQAAASGSGGATGAAEASEAAPHLAADMFAKESSFKSLGINIRSKKNPALLGNLKDILKQTLVATGGDFGQLQELFGQRSVKGVSAFANAYARAGEGLKGPAAKEAKLAAVNKVFEEYEKAGMTAEQTHKESAARLTESDKQLEIVLNQLREAVGAQLVPELVKLIPAVKELIGPFTVLLQKSVEFAEWLAKNPYEGIGAIISARVVADLAMAGIGASVKAALMAMLGGGGAASGAGALAGGGGAAGSGVAALAGTVAIGGALGAGAGAALTERASKAQLLSQRGTFGALSENETAIAGLGSNPSAERKEALRAKIQGDIAAAESGKRNAEPGALVNALGYATGQGSEIAAAKKTEVDAFSKSIVSLTEQLTRLGAATSSVKNDPARSAPIPAR